uniref:Uncharacterized protein n=1 Tax=Oncorhynchus mykiss TaxID=8022 RepID=A0A8K9UZM1_ONCMY
TIKASKLAQPTSPHKHTVKNRSKSTDEIQQAKKVDDIIPSVSLLILSSGVAKQSKALHLSAQRRHYRPWFDPGLYHNQP